MLLIISLFITVAWALIVWSYTYKDTISLSPRVKKDIEGEMVIGEDLMRRPLWITRPFFGLNRALLGRFRNLNRSIRLNFSFLGIRMLPEDFLSIKYLITIALCAIVFLLFRRIEPLWLLIIFGVGFVLPDMHIRGLIKKRKNAILRAFPDAVDLLTLCVEGGLDFIHGLNWVVDRSTPGPLTKELALVLHEIKMGKSRHEALKGLSKRVDISDVFSFVNTLIHADRMGSPIADVLKSLAEEARRRRFQRGERMALQAPIKMLFPLIFFILPVVGIIVGAPILMKFVGAGMPKF